MALEGFVGGVLGGGFELGGLGVFDWGGCFGVGKACGAGVGIAFEWHCRVKAKGSSS